MASLQPRRNLTGVVVSAGKMINTVKVRVPKQVWNKHLQKYYSEPQTLLVSDPTNSTREGDVIALEGGRRISRHVRHVVAGVIAPMGPPMSKRARIPTAAERVAAVEAKRAAKDVRQAARGRWPAIVRIREREALAAHAETGGEMEKKPVMQVDAFVRLYRKRRDELLIGDFLYIAGYQALSGVVPLNAQAAALVDARKKLWKSVTKLEQRLKDEEAVNIQAREQLAKEKLQLTERIDQISRTLAHFREYRKQLDEPDMQSTLQKDPIQWYDLVRALNMNHWEQNIAALDLFGGNAIQEAGASEMAEVLLRAGVEPQATTPKKTEKPRQPEQSQSAPPTSATPDLEVIDEAALRASEIEEQELAADAVAEDLKAIDLDEPVREQVIEHLPEEAEPAVSEGTALNVESSAAPEVESEQAQDSRVSEKKAEQAPVIGAEKETSSAADTEAKEETDRKSGGLWGFFGRR